LANLSVLAQKDLMKNAAGLLLALLFVANAPCWAAPDQ
jgi:hypothetical protein